MTLSLPFCRPPFVTCAEICVQNHALFLCLIFFRCVIWAIYVMGMEFCGGADSDVLGGEGFGV